MHGWKGAAAFALHALQRALAAAARSPVNLFGMKAVDLRKSLHLQGYLRALGLGVLDESTSQKLKSTTVLVQEAASIPWIDGGDAGTDRQTESVGVVVTVVVCALDQPTNQPTNQQCMHAG